MYSTHCKHSMYKKTSLFMPGFMLYTVTIPANPINPPNLFNIFLGCGKQLKQLTRPEESPAIKLYNISSFECSKTLFMIYDSN